MLRIGSVANDRGEVVVFQNQETGEYGLSYIEESFALQLDGDTVVTVVHGDGGADPRSPGDFYKVIDTIEGIIKGSRGLTPYDLLKKDSKHPFEYQKPTDEQVKKITEIREAMKVLYELLLTLPESRERSVAITKLEEASMWANKGIIMQ